MHIHIDWRARAAVRRPDKQDTAAVEARLRQLAEFYGLEQQHLATLMGEQCMRFLSGCAEFVCLCVCVCV